MKSNKMNKFTIYTDGSCDNIIYPNYGKKNERDKMLAELIQGIIDDNKTKGKDYIQNIVKDINLIFNH